MAKGQHEINMGINIPNANSHSALCVKVLSEVCTKFNKTPLCVICAQHLAPAKFNTQARANAHAHTADKHRRTHTCTL